MILNLTRTEVHNNKTKQMSSIYRDRFEKEAKEEIGHLERKRIEYGWTQKDADRYNMLKKELN